MASANSKIELKFGSREDMLIRKLTDALNRQAKAIEHQNELLIEIARADARTQHVGQPRDIRED